MRVIRWNHIIICTLLNFTTYNFGLHIIAVFCPVVFSFSCVKLITTAVILHLSECLDIVCKCTSFVCGISYQVLLEPSLLII